MSDETSVPESNSPRPYRDRVGEFLSLCAGLAAITAVAVSLYQASLARAQLRASAWPYLSQGNSWVTGQPYKRLMSNDGVGPARIRSFAVLVDRKPVDTWNNAVRALTGEGEPNLIYSGVGRGTVFAPGAPHTLLELPDSPRTRTFYVQAQTRLATVVCYCSVYDECWIADSREDEPRSVKDCPVDTSFKQ